MERKRDRGRPAAEEIGRPVRGERHDTVDSGAPAWWREAPATGAFQVQGVVFTCSDKVTLER